MDHAIKAVPSSAAPPARSAVRLYVAVRARGVQVTPGQLRNVGPMRFDVVGPITEQRTIAAGRRIRELPRIVKTYGPGWWRKRAGTAWVRHADGTMRLAELHWYEAAGIGRRELKIKGYLDFVP